MIVEKDTVGEDRNREVLEDKWCKEADRNDKEVLEDKWGKEADRNDKEVLEDT